MTDEDRELRAASIKLRRAWGIVRLAWGCYWQGYRLEPFHPGARTSLEAYLGDVPGDGYQPTRRELERWLALLRQLVEGLETGLKHWPRAQHTLIEWRCESERQRDEI